MPKIRSLTPADRNWVRQRMIEEWGAEIIVVHGDIIRPAELAGFVTESEGNVVGLITYQIKDQACEIVTLNAWQEGLGIGTALIEAVKKIACQNGCRRLWLITTNDNVHALRFYQKRGFVLAGIQVNAVTKSRLLKPEIPLTGEDGIPIRDEIELEKAL